MTTQLDYSMNVIICEKARIIHNLYNNKNIWNISLLL